MKSVYGVLMRLLVVCPLSFQGYVMPEHVEKFEPPNIGVNAGWILLLICIIILLVVYILFRTQSRSHKSRGGGS
jgi:protein-S-isoprenylcysteine O-methyltransferase Ste14